MAMKFVFLIFISAIAGAFINRIIFRLPRKLSMVKPLTSTCQSCRQPLSWLDVTPFVGYLYQKGACRQCGVPIPLRYLLCELMAVVLGGWIAYRYAGGLNVTAHWVFWMSMTTLFWIDFESKLLPQSITYPLMGIGLGSLAYRHVGPEVLRNQLIITAA
ncbi:prepilin peptidase, partial [bacterium]|nr:prepilin peptidase [bacterium]